MDMMSDFENMEIILGNGNINPIEREFSNVIGNSENHCDSEFISQNRENIPQGNGFWHYVHENIIPGQFRSKKQWKRILVNLK